MRHRHRHHHTTGHRDAAAAAAAAVSGIRSVVGGGVQSFRKPDGIKNEKTGGV